MLDTVQAANIPDTRQVLRTAIAHARYRLARWIEPEGISQEECLNELIQLLFHPAIDVVTLMSPPSEDADFRILWEAVRESRDALQKHAGPKGFLPADECLDSLLGILDNRRVMNAGDFRPMLTIIQWGPAFPRRRRPNAWCIRRALGSDCTERVFIDVSGA